MIDNHLKEEFQEYQKRKKQQISEIIRKAEGRTLRIKLSVQFLLF